MAKQKEAWDKLSMQEKALLIKLSVDNGVSSLKLIRDTYNLYSSDSNHKYEGNIESTLNLSIIGKDRLQDIAYRIMSLGPAESRSIEDIIRGVKLSYTDAPYELNYMGTNMYGAGLGKADPDPNRDSNYMFLYGNVKGHYTPITKEEYRGHSYAPFIKEHYPNKKVYNYRGLFIPLEKVELPTYTKSLVEFLSKNDLCTYNAVLDPKNEEEFNRLISSNYTVDDVGSFITGVGVSPKGNPEFQLSDIIDFGGGYSTKWGLKAGIQGALLNAIGNPFMLRLYIPIEYTNNPEKINESGIGTLLKMALDNNVASVENDGTLHMMGSPFEVEVTPKNTIVKNVSGEIFNKNLYQQLADMLNREWLLKAINPMYSNGGNLVHKKSGEELGETSWLNNGYNSSEDWLLLMKMQTNQMLQNLLNSPFYMTDLEMLNLEFTRMQEAMNNNPSSEFITYTGFDNNGNEITKRLPATKGLNTMMDAGVVDYMPTLGDAKLAVEAVVAAKQGDYLTAGLLGGMMFLPNIIEKPLKKWKKVRNLTKELKERPLLQVIDDEEINAWLAENWYKNEIHNARPVLKSRTVSIDDFDKNGMPLHYKLGDDLPTLKRGNDNILIHVDSRLPLLAGRKGFLPLDGYTGDSPAIWWQRDYPYYIEPSSLSFSGHTLKVKEGDVIPLEPLRRYPNSPGPIVVTEGVLPYNILEGYKWNSDLSWFERERFAPAKSILDYFKYNNLPEWFTYSTGGPLYPFSFEKNPFLKTPAVRYDDGGPLNNWEQGALDRATKVYSNYELAKDNKIPSWRIPLQKKLKQLDLPSGLSNCTLTATQWVDPTNPIMSAATIFNNPKTGYVEIDNKDAIPGNLLITKNPETGGYHTMMIEGFTDSGEPILRYSNGNHTADALRTNISLSEYHSRDNSHGGNHTEDHYFRYNYPNEVFLPEITVFAKRGLK